MPGVKGEPGGMGGNGEPGRPGIPGLTVRILFYIFVSPRCHIGDIESAKLLL